MTKEDIQYLEARASDFTSWAKELRYGFRFSAKSHAVIRDLIWATKPVENSDVRMIQWRGKTVYAHAWQPKNPSGDPDGKIIVNLLDPKTAEDSIELASHGLGRIWHDGRGEQHVGYNEHDIIDTDPECVHDLEKETISVHFFQGNYNKKMRKCSKCGGHVDADMIDHPKGRHEFGQIKKDGFRKCQHCELSISALPVMYLGGGFP